MKNKIINKCCVFLVFSLIGIIGLNAQENEENLVNVAFGTVEKEDVINGISVVNVSELLKKSYTTGSVNNLESLVSGYTGNLWGQAPLILIDGIPRDAMNVQASEVETITFMKDASAVVLYGSRASKGVILITTKRGKSQPMKIDFRANGGIYVPKSYPKYLDADCYMTLYNEASVNDGLAPRYDASTIYHTAQGTNPFRYPDVDYYSSDYLRSTYYQTDLTGEVYGGNDRTKYYLNLGMLYNNDLLNYGEAKNNYDMRLNVRGNVDMTLTSWLKVTANTAILMTDDYKGRGNFWGTAATFRPNWFSPLVPIDYLAPNVSSFQDMVNSSDHVIDGEYLLGGTSTDMTNAFADMLAAGYVKEKERRFMFDVGVEADLGSILKGLSFKTVYSMDYNAHYSEAWREEYAVYEPTWSNVNGTDLITALTKHNEDIPTNNEYVGTSRYDQTMSFSAQFDYKNTFAEKHNLAATLLGWGYQVQNTADADHEGSAYHRTSNVNLGLRLAYNYAQKYYIDLSGAVVHSAKLPEGKRNAFSPSISLGWRISKEDFFDLGFVNELKLTASYANLHQDLDITDYYLYKGYFANNGGWYQWHDGTAGGNTTGSRRGENPNLTFITREEVRVGLDATLFDKLITLNTNFFMQDTKGLLTQGASTIYPSYFKINDEATLSFLPYLNYNNDRRTGIDFSVNINKKLGAVDASLGFVGMYLTSEATRRDEVYSYDYQHRKGRALDATYAYVCEGYIQTQEEADAINDPENLAYPLQTFGTVRPGDLKYKDINGDGQVDSNDQIDLGKSGNSVPPFSFGLNLTLKWNNFTFFAMGSGLTGAIGFKNSSYYWNRSSSKYSEVVWGRWTEETKETATYPRLTTTNGDNNFRNSTYWMYKKDRFNLTRVQLTYDFPKSILGNNSFVKGLSAYVNGDNLLVISQEREFLEMNVGSRPQCRFYNLGVKVNF
jgi:TonB-linked outer membrane protein, SusC/RagA family